MKTFRGGVHPPDKKAETEFRPIEELKASNLLYIPMKQHQGEECVPIVKKGDAVFMGQKIGEAKSAINAHVHSSVSGVVKEIEAYDHPSGSKELTVVIENDGKDTKDPSIQKNGSVDTLTPAQIVKVVKAAGIVGMGGAGFATHVKLTIPEGRSIEQVIINGAECEPYLTSDNRTLLENPDDVVAGLRLAMKASGAKHGVIAIEKNKVDAIKLMQEKTESYPNIEVLPLKTKYPQGSKKQLIRVVTGREVPSGKLPADVHVVVLNIDTVSCIARAVATGMPLISRIVTVSGSAVCEPKNLRVRIGTRICDLFEYCGGFKTEVYKILFGGPMMGLAQFTDKVPIIKTSSAVLALSKEDTKLKLESPCIKCGKCAQVCPMGLMPVYMNLYTLTSQLDEVRKLGVLDCIECGSCSYICLANRYLVQSFKIAKQNI